MKGVEKIECSIRIGSAVRTLLNGHGTSETMLVLLAVKETRKQLDELEQRLQTFEDREAP